MIFNGAWKFSWDKFPPNMKKFVPVMKAIKAGYDQEIFQFRFEPQQVREGQMLPALLDCFCESVDFTLDNLLVLTRFQPEHIAFDGPNCLNVKGIYDRSHHIDIGIWTALPTDCPRFFEKKNGLEKLLPSRN